MDINDSGAHTFQTKDISGKVGIQVEGQVNSHPGSAQVRKLIFL